MDARPAGFTLVPRFFSNLIDNPVSHATISQIPDNCCDEDSTMEEKRCPVFVDGKECGLPLTPVDRKAENVTRYEAGIYQCQLGHRSYFLSERKGPGGSSREPDK